MCREQLIDFSLYKINPNKGTIFSTFKNQYVDGCVKENNYIQVKLKCKDNTRKTFYLQRVIWYYVNGDIPPEMQVNHIDENKANNSILNLNLMSPSDNCNWGTRNKRLSEMQIKKPILQYDKNGTLINEYESLNEIHKKYGYYGINISRCCRNIYKQAYGYVWRYKNDQPN